VFHTKLNFAVVKKWQFFTKLYVRAVEHNRYTDFDESGVEECDAEKTFKGGV
jgi:hypothetical protein